jgi:uncharacterized membrane protein
VDREPCGRGLGVCTGVVVGTVDLGTLGGTYSQATAVSSDVVVGVSSTAGDLDGHAFAYDLAAPSPAMRDLGRLGAFQYSRQWR